MTDAACDTDCEAGRSDVTYMLGRAYLLKVRGLPCPTATCDMAGPRVWAWCRTASDPPPRSRAAEEPIAVLRHARSRNP